MSFRIAAPFIEAEKVRALKEAGADELFCGLVDASSERRWPAALHVLNRRGKGASFESRREFAHAVEEARACGLPVYLAMNGLYTPEQYGWVISTIDWASALPGVQGLIVADLGLLLTLRGRNYRKELCMSTGGTSFNASTVNFFGSLGVRRVVLDRQLTSRETGEILSRREGGIEAEILVFYTGCLFIDGYCASYHFTDLESVRSPGKGIEMVRTYDVRSARYGMCETLNRSFDEGRYEVCRRTAAGPVAEARFRKDRYLYGCSLCDLYDLKGHKGVVLKVSGRGGNPARAVAAVSELTRHLSSKDGGRARFRERCRATYRALTGSSCSAFRCFCPAPVIGRGPHG